MPPTRTPKDNKKLVRGGNFPAAGKDAIAWQRAPPASKTVAVKTAPSFTKLLADKGALRPLIDRPGTLSSRATNMMDGRNQPVVVAVVRDKDGRPAPGLVARLLQDGELRDHTRTDKRGVAILLFPKAHGHAGMNGAAPTKGRVEILIPGDDNENRDITIPAHKQHVISEFILERVPQFDMVMDADSEGAHALAAMMSPSVPLIDNPLDRLPADFSTELCDDLTKLLGAPEDPILGLGANNSDFRKRRIPIVKRMTVARLGAFDPVKKTAPRRYLVRLRQEWNFVGYSLGELVDVNALSPGSVVDDAVRTVQRATSELAETVSDSSTRIGESITSELHQAASVDVAVDIATRVRTQAAAGGFVLGIPGVFGVGGVGAAASVSTTTAVRSRTHTSLDVNASLHMAKTILNTASKTVHNTRQDLQRVASSALSQVSPLLSRVTNLLKWTLYENYVVCTHVEDVLEVQDHTIANLTEPGQNGLLFTDEQIVDLRRVFSPGLLEPRLRGRFASLAAAVDARRGALLPITAVHVTLEATAGAGGATATARIGPDETTFRIRSGTSRVTQVIRLSNPILAEDLPNMDIDLALGPDFSLPFGGVTISNQAQIARVELGFQSASGFVRRQSVPMGDDLAVSAANRTEHAEVDLVAPPPAIFTDADPLVVHVNRNRTYYFGLLCQAALLEPNLRNDWPHFDEFGPDHPIWRLPIVGFEGNRALVVSDADASLDEVKELLKDPGSATLIQLAAPGAYGEALQGLLKLATDVEQLHPQLLPPLAPAMPPLAIVDLTGKTVPLPIGGSTSVPIGGGVPLPTPPGG